MQFRKLCILKGVFPRVPKKRLQGANKTYYHLKDVKFLERDPIINSFRELKIFKRRVANAKAKKEPERLKTLHDAAPKYTLHHVLLQRYPTFADALQDFDDALCLVHLIARHPLSLVRRARCALCALRSLPYTHSRARTHARSPRSV